MVNISPHITVFFGINTMAKNQSISIRHWYHVTNMLKVPIGFNHACIHDCIAKSAAFKQVHVCKFTLVPCAIQVKFTH